MRASETETTCGCSTLVHSRHAASHTGACEQHADAAKGGGRAHSGTASTPERVRHLVYQKAGVLRDGQAAVSERVVELLLGAFRLLEPDGARLPWLHDAEGLREQCGEGEGVSYAAVHGLGPRLRTAGLPRDALQLRRQLVRVRRLYKR